MSDNRKLLTAVKDRPEDPAFEVWEEPNGKITLMAGDATVLTATTSSGVVGITEVVSLTQAQYDGLVSPAPKTLYVIVG